MSPRKEPRNPKIPLTRREKQELVAKRVFFCTIAAVIMAFNLKSFVYAGDLFPGGFAGASLLIIRSVEKFLHVTIPYSAVYIPMNLLTIYVGFRYIGKKFTGYSLYVVVLGAILTDLLPAIPITYDTLLICLFGGIINGGAISLCLVYGASAGGTDFISIYLSERKGINAYNYIFAGNVAILAIAGVLFGWDKALYSILYQYCTTQVIQFLFKRYDKSTLLIITDMPNVVYDKISILTKHDATQFEGVGFYKESKKFLIYSVVSSEDVDMLIYAIKSEDPHAFINVLKTDTLSGRFYRKPKD